MNNDNQEQRTSIERRTNYSANKDTRRKREEGREGKGSEAKNPQLK